MDTISKIRIKGVDYPIEDENAGGLELICSFATLYDEPYWQEGSDCYFAQITKEQYDLFNTAIIVKTFANPGYDSYSERPILATHFAQKGQIGEYNDIGDSGENLYVATKQYDSNYYLCATQSYFEKYIRHGTEYGGFGAQFDFYK